MHGITVGVKEKQLLVTGEEHAVTVYPDISLSIINPERFI